MQLGSFIPPSSISAVQPTSKVTIGPRQTCSKNIKLHKQGDIVKTIEVQCSCGEVILIECHYQ